MRRTAALTAVLLLLCACNRDEEITADEFAPVITLTGCDDSGTYYVHPGESLTIAPDYENARGAEYSWTLGGEVVCREPSWTAIWPETGFYTVTLTVSTDAGTAREQLYVSVAELQPPVFWLPRPEGGFRVEAGCELLLVPQFRYGRPAADAIVWSVDGRREATGGEFSFVRDTPGSYAVRVEISNADGTAAQEIAVEVVESMLSVNFPPMLLMHPGSGVHVGAGLPVSLVPRTSGFRAPVLAWTVDGAPAGAGDALVFVPSASCIVELTVTETEGRNDGRSASASVAVYVSPLSARRPVSAGSSRRLTAVAEYMPAPGQFVDENSDLACSDHDEACIRALRTMQAGGYVSLGAYGGYIVAAFDHSITPSGAAWDIAVGGNSFVAAVGSSNEPGTVWVAPDANGNGEPDDEWYVLRGSDMADSPRTQMLDVTYYRPDVPQTDVPWTASDGRRGTVDYLPEFHDQPCYYPAWAPDCYTLRGISLSARNYPEGGTWTLPAAAWGYADNAGSDSFELLPPAGHGGLYTGLRIENAVAADGTPVKLPFVDFVMVRSATVGKSGWLGEISTEVTDVVDYSMIDN